MKAPKGSTSLITQHDDLYRVIHSKLCDNTCGNQSAHDITEFCSVNMDVWYYRISVACDVME
jgi:hypothetical protein